MEGWIGVDLDGTLAKYEQWLGAGIIGEPIPVMVERVKAWLAEGKNIRILTARVFAANGNYVQQRDAAIAMLTIQDWCITNLGQVLPVTCTKDFGMIELWDDRSIQVERNVGTRVDGQ